MKLDTLILIWRIAHWCGRIILWGTLALLMLAILAVLASPLLQLFGIDLLGGINGT